nr:MAG TPA: abortive infection protein [Caudoviricetes sp.]
MNILVIGNGFDLAHGLPTKYGDFLDSVEAVKLFNNGYNKFLENLKNDKKELYKKVLPLENDNRLKEGYVEDLNKYIENNFWIEHFLEIRASKREIGENWIDFETEIGDVLKKLEFNSKPDYVFKKAIYNICLNHKKLYEENEYYFSKLISFIKRHGGHDYKDPNETINSEVHKLFSCREIDFIDEGWSDEYKDLIKLIIIMLEIDLDRLIRAFEVYIEYVVKEIPIKNFLGDLKYFVDKIDKVISFNYTDTYFKILDYIANNIQKYKLFEGKVIHDSINDVNTIKQTVFYIHGESKKENIDSEIDTEKNKDTMILGVYEKLKDEKNINDKFIYFKKYYQRIQKNTDNKDADNIKNNKETNIEKLYIIGHSLDVSDNDLLETLILQSKETIIYHHNNESKKIQIINLIKMLGQKKLVEYRNDNRIRFKLQSNELK